MTKDDFFELIQEHKDYGGYVHQDTLAERLAELFAAGASEGQTVESIADELSTSHGHHVEDERDPKPTGHWWTFDRDALADFAKRVAHPSAEIAALRERIAGMEKDAERARWIDVETRAPECGKWVLATNGKWTGVAAYFTDVVDSDEHWQDERREFIEMLGPKVTHWMPLPAAPTR